MRPRAHRHRLLVRPVLTQDRPIVENLLRDSEVPGIETWIAAMWDRWLRGAGSLLTVAETAERLRLSKSYVKKLIADGTVPSVKVGGTLLTWMGMVLPAAQVPSSSVAVAEMT